MRDVRRVSGSNRRKDQWGPWWVEESEESEGGNPGLRVVGCLHGMDKWA